MPHDEEVMNVKEEKSIDIVYTNYRGETRVRRVIPSKIRFGATEWHPDRQWLLDAFDVSKAAQRTFALKDIKAWF